MKQPKTTEAPQNYKQKRERSTTVAPTGQAFTAEEMETAVGPVIAGWDPPGLAAALGFVQLAVLKRCGVRISYAPHKHAKTAFYIKAAKRSVLVTVHSSHTSSPSDELGEQLYVLAASLSSGVSSKEAGGFCYGPFGGKNLSRGQAIRLAGTLVFLACVAANVDTPVGTIPSTISDYLAIVVRAEKRDREEAEAKAVSEQNHPDTEPVA